MNLGGLDQFTKEGKEKIEIRANDVQIIDVIYYPNGSWTITSDNSMIGVGKSSGMSKEEAINWVKEDLMEDGFKTFKVEYSEGKLYG